MLRHSSPGVGYFFGALGGAPAVRFRPIFEWSAGLCYSTTVNDRTTVEVTPHAKLGIRPAAASTYAEDREVPDVDREAVIGGDCSNRRFENSRGHLGYSPAFPAYEM